MVLAELVIGSLRRAAGWRRRLQNIGHKPEWVAAVPHLAHEMLAKSSNSWRPMDRASAIAIIREIIELDPERVFEVIADVVRSIPRPTLASTPCSSASRRGL